MGQFVEMGFRLHGAMQSVSALIGHLARCQPSRESLGDTGDALAALAALKLPSLCLWLDWWREPNGQKEPFKKTAFKLWAGQQTSQNIYSTLQKTVATMCETNKSMATDPFHSRAGLTGRFGFDPGAAWNALDAGFSPNEQGYNVASSPVVELLAAIGLQRFRPVPEADDRDAFRYLAWSTPLPVDVAAAAAAGAVADPKPRVFRFRIASRGSYGSFTSATEIGRLS